MFNVICNLCGSVVSSLFAVVISSFSYENRTGQTLLSVSRLARASLLSTQYLVIEKSYTDPVSYTVLTF